MFLAKVNNIPAAKANQIFDLLEKFAGYGFNKSHAAAYAIVAYQTAYLKANYPVEFLAASMTLDLGNTDKLNEFREDAKKHGIEIVAPSVNTSEAVFAGRDGKIFYAIGAIKGVGQAVAEHIVEARGQTPFKDLADFATRVDPRIINKAGPDWLWMGGREDVIRNLYFKPNGAFRRYGRIGLFATLVVGSTAFLWMLHPLM